MNVFVPPDQWSSNEWLITGLIIAGWSFVYVKRRRFPNPLLVLMLMASFMIAMMLDLLIGAPPLDMYDINDNEHVEWFDMLLYIVYPPFGFLFLYLYDRLRTLQNAALAYIVLFSVFGIGVEWLMDVAGVFQYKGWKFCYSYPAYLLSQGTYLLFFHWIRHCYYSTKKK